MLRSLQHSFSSSKKPDEEDVVTVFSCVRNRRTWIYLVGFLFFSAVIHGAGFYLFQVVYPTPSRVEPDQGEIVLLDPADPAIRNLLQRVEDRSVYFLPVSQQTNVRVELEDAIIPFSPSFGKAPLELISPEYSWSIPYTGLREGPEIENLQPLPTSVTVEKEGDLSDRTLAPWSVLDDYLSRADWIPDIRVRLSISPEGTVSVNSVEGEIDEESRDSLVRVIESTLRFLPSNASSEGWIRIFATSP